MGLANDEIEQSDQEVGAFIKKCGCFDEGDLSLIETTFHGDEPYKLTSTSCQRVKTDDKITISIKYGLTNLNYRSWGYTIYTTDKEAGCSDSDIKGMITSHTVAMECIKMIENTCRAL